MNKRLKGYMTVEATFVMPFVLMLYLLIILSGFYLYDRCVMSQDQYLIAFRGSRFTYGAENYGEVIYGDMVMGTFDRQYTEKRLLDKLAFYPFCEDGTVSAALQGDRVSVLGTGFRGLLTMKKEVKQINPLVVVREKRREKHG